MILNSYNRYNLLRIKFIRKFLLSLKYPAWIQYFSIFILIYLLFYSFWGTSIASKNPTTVLIWSIWWTILPVLLLLTARFWCCICPSGAINDFIQSYIKPMKTHPPNFLKKYGIWLMIISFLLITLLDRIYEIINSTVTTGLMVLSLVSASIVISLIYDRRVWCRYLCPIGALIGIYSMCSPFEIRSNQDICKSNCKKIDCYHGNNEIRGCPFWEVPRVMNSSRNCSICANCIKLCPYDALSLNIRYPGTELFNIPNPLLSEAFLIISVIFLVYFQTLPMTPLYPKAMKYIIEEAGIGNYNMALVLLFVSVILFFLSFYLILSFVLSKITDISFKQTISVFSYAYIPVALFAHIGHNIYHIIFEGRTAIQNIINEIGIPIRIFAPAEMSATEFQGIPGYIRNMQIFLLITGGLLAFYIINKIAKKYFAGNNPDGSFKMIKIMGIHLILITGYIAVFYHILSFSMVAGHIH